MVPGVGCLVAILLPSAARLAAQAATPASLPSWVSVDTSSRTIRLMLETTAPPDSGAALLNGYRRGEAQLVVPLNWTVRWTWRNADNTRSHSLVVMMEREKLPMEGGRAAFTNAMTRAVTSGLKPGQSDVTTFTTEEAGWFWLLCGVPNHALAGEWIGLRVDPAARMASVKVR